MMNTPDTHEPIVFTVALDTVPTVTGTALYYVGDNAVISLEDLVITDPDVIYETKDYLQVRISCTAGRFTVTSPGAVAFTGDTLGVSEQDVTMTGTRAAVQSALISVVYTADSTSWDTISIVATALASVITPNLAGSLAVSIQYSCSQASAPRISSATFHSTQAAIEIWFDRATTMSTGTFDCSTLFDTSTVFYFGIGAACSFSTADNLKVALGTNPVQPTTLQPGSNLVFKDRLLRSCATSSDYFSGTVVVGSPLTTAFPNVTIDAPSQVSSCDALRIDGSSSQGYGGLPITYSWTMNSSFVNDTSVTLASTTASSVTFASADLVKFDGSVQLFLTITDYLKQTSIATAVQVPVKATASPQPSITMPSLTAIVTSSVSIGGESVRVPEYSVYASTKTTLNGAMFVPEFAKTPGVAWIISWTCVSHSSINSALQCANTMSLTVPASTMAASTTYRFSMTVTSGSDSTNQVKAYADVKAVASPVTVTLDGGLTKDHFSGVDLSLNAVLKDPNTMSDSWLASWTCGVEPSLSACTSSSGGSLSLQVTTTSSSTADGQSRALIPAGTLTAGQTYRFTVLGNRTLRTDTDFISVSVKAYQVPEVSIAQAKPTTAKANPSDKVQLLATAAGAYGGTLSYAWECTTSSLTLQAGTNTASSLTGSSLVVKPGILFSGVTYNFQLTVTETMSDGSSVTAVANADVEVNTPPQTGTVSVSPGSGIEAQPCSRFPQQAGPTRMASTRTNMHA